MDSMVSLVEYNMWRLKADHNDRMIIAATQLLISF